MPPTIVCAKSTEAPLVSSVLTEAAHWVASRSEPLWRNEHVSIEAVAADVAAGLYYIAWLNDEAVGVARFQLEDAIFWPEAIEGEGVYLHRLAVRRRYAGGGISGALLNWAVHRASELGRRYVSLDCAVDRLSLRNVYERFGFRLHSERNVGRFIVARYQFDANPAA